MYGFRAYHSSVWGMIAVTCIIDSSAIMHVCQSFHRYASVVSHTSTRHVTEMSWAVLRATSVSRITVIKKLIYYIIKERIPSQTSYFLGLKKSAPCTLVTPFQSVPSAAVDDFLTVFLVASRIFTLCWWKASEIMFPSVSKCIVLSHGSGGSHVRVWFAQIEIGRITGGVDSAKLCKTSRRLKLGGSLAGWTLQNEPEHFAGTDTRWTMNQTLTWLPPDPCDNTIDTGKHGFW